MCGTPKSSLKISTASPSTVRIKVEAALPPVAMGNPPKTETATAREMSATHTIRFFMISSFAVEVCPRSPQTSGAVRCANVDNCKENLHGEINEKFCLKYL
jgi:hypothetical protein